MGVPLVGVRHHLFELSFHMIHIFARRQPGPVAESIDMCIDRDRRHAPSDIKHHIRRLAPDPGQLLQRIAILWHLADMIVDELLAQLDDVLRLVVEQANRLDVVAHLGFAQRQHFVRVVGNLEQRAGRLVDSHIGRLRGQNDSDQQGIGIRVVKLALRFRIGRLKAAEKGFDIGFFHGLGLTGSGVSPGGQSDRALLS